MITKKDAKSYYDQMLATELKMANCYKNLHTQLKDPKYKKRFSDLEQEEYMHAEKVQELIDDLETYWKD